jgi:hypothetical protein
MRRPLLMDVVLVCIYQSRPKEGGKSQRYELGQRRVAALMSVTAVIINRTGCLNIIREEVR